MTALPAGFEASAPGMTAPAAPDTAGSSYPVTVRYFAAAWAATGVEEETITVAAGPDGRPPTVADVLAAAVDRHGAELERVLTRCSYLRNAVAVHEVSTVVQAGDTLDVLPPFAGG